MSRQPLRRLVYSALFLAIGIVLPIFTDNIPNIGASLLPMHIPVLLCGLIFLLCGGTAVFQAYLTWRRENDPLRSELERVRSEFLNSEDTGKK